MIGASIVTAQDGENATATTDATRDSKSANDKSMMIPVGATSDRYKDVHAVTAFIDS